MDKLSRQEQVWLTVFTAALVGPKHGFTDAYDIAGAAARLFKQQFGEDASAPFSSLSKEQIEGCPQASWQEKFEDAAIVAAKLGDERDEILKRVVYLERSLQHVKDNALTSIGGYQAELKKVAGELQECQAKLAKAQTRLQEFDSFKEDAGTVTAELAGKLERRDAEIQELRTLLEEMTKSISERDELIAKIRAERDEFEGRLISNMTREALRLDA
jgi:chromosome segregation ATPase